VRTSIPEWQYRSVRVAWILWLSSLALLFAWPALYMQLPGVSDVVVIATGAGGLCARADCAPERWLVMEWSTWQTHASLCVALALGIVVPAVDLRAVRIRLRAFVWRLVLAMAFGCYGFWELSMPRFVKNYGCVGWETFTVPEYLTYASALAAVMCAHIPTRRRVFARRPSAPSRSARRAALIPENPVP
jgi:hypothetical protein